MKKIFIISSILVSMIFLGCSGTTVVDNKIGIKNPSTSANVPVQDNRPRPFPAGVK
jgi:hypothetical protein